MQGTGAGDAAPDTDPTGVTFISYSRRRLHEAELLVRTLHEHGIPTWKDTEDLAHEPTAPAIRSTLRDPTTANAILWITPETGQSNFILKCEAPEILKRARSDDRFFVIPVAAGGLSYHEAAAQLEPALSLEDLRAWNLYRMEQNPLTLDAAQALSRRVLKQRLRLLRQRLPGGEPLTLRLDSKGPAPESTPIAIKMDWSEPLADPGYIAQAWSERLLPALNAVSDLARREAGQRPIQATGQPHLFAALALGWIFPEPSRTALTWQQHSGSDEQPWALASEPTDSGFRHEIKEGSLEGDGLAVMVSVTNDVSSTLQLRGQNLPRFRAYVSIRKPGAELPVTIKTPGEAAHIARETNAAIRQARAQFSDLHTQTVHIFAAIPAGLAMMMGQLMNTFPRIQTYEFAGGTYTPAALLEQ